MIQPQQKSDGASRIVRRHTAAYSSDTGPTLEIAVLNVHARFTEQITQERESLLTMSRRGARYSHFWCNRLSWRLRKGGNRCE